MAENKAVRPVTTGVHYRKNKYAAPIGGIFLLLAALGLAALTFVCVHFTQGLLDNSSEKQRFEQVIMPVLMFDPVAFEKPTDLSPEFLLQTSLWSTLLGEKRSSYQTDALGRLVVPASDVDIGCARLYGGEVKLVHQSIGDYETMYVYDEATKTYYIPVEGQTGLYTPGVERVIKNGDVYTLTVGYIPPANAFTRLTAEDGQIPADKYMIYELLKEKENYQLRAIRYMPNTQGGSGNTAGLPVISSSTASSIPSVSLPEISSSAVSSQESSILEEELSSASE